MLRGATAAMADADEDSPLTRTEQAMVRALAAAMVPRVRAALASTVEHVTIGAEQIAFLDDHTHRGREAA
jgi:hypothetical protein